MIHLISAVNWLSILAAFVAYSFLGAMWFTFLFKKPYAASLGKTPDTLQNSTPIFFVGPMICSLAITITSAMLMKALGIDSYGEAAGFALLAGTGYLFANTMNIAINPNMPKPIPYGIISGVFHLVGLLIVCTILTAMN